MIVHCLLTNLLLVSVSTLFILYPVQAGPITRGRVKTCEDEVQGSLSQSYDWSSSNALSLAKCLQQSMPKRNTCVFYTSGNRDDAIDYAAERDLKTIYDVYEPKWFNTSIEPAQTWLKNGHLRKVFQVTSRAYAMSCSGQATLVMPQDVDPCPTSIWVTDEYDAIKKKLSNITHVLKASHVLVDGVWGWIVSRIVGVDSGSNAKTLNARGVDDIDALQRMFGNAPLLKKIKNKNLSIADAFRIGDDDDWAVHCDASCTY